MADKNFTLISYYVPEDKDDIEILNAFGIKKAAEDLRLSDISSGFPLEGQYHFRFKYRHGTDFVWLDLVNPNCKLPVVDGKIVMKVARETWDGSSSRVSASASAPASIHEVPEQRAAPAKKGVLLEGLDSPPLVSSEPPFDMGRRSVWLRG